jgi:hypothetical protein
VTERNGNDPGLDALLELDGEVFPMDRGYWTKFEVRQVDPTPQIPHGIRYSITLHDSTNRRVLGYDNAHAVKSQRKNYRAKRCEWDHKHDREQITHYDFESPGQLMEDFWADVNRITT